MASIATIRQQFENSASGFGGCGILSTTYTGTGGLEHEKHMTFHSVGNVIIPTDFHSIIFQDG